MPNEADTCRQFVVPKLQAAGWDNESHSIAERGIDFPTVAAQAGKPEADPFDLPCHFAFNAPVDTRRLWS
jgi:type I site-specific restriction endonuclease